jgi:hypothetical protein
MKSLISNIKQDTNAARNDLLLHFSTHLQHDRHTAIYHKQGYPTDTWDRPWMNTLPLLQGTAIHNHLHSILPDYYQSYEAEQPVNASRENFKYFWTGTVDAYIIDHDDTLWLIDYKTISGSSFEYLDGPKPEHVMQASAYYHFNTITPDKMAIVYLPTSADYRRRWPEPEVMEFEPISLDDMRARIIQVEHAIDVYYGLHKLPDYPQGEYKWRENKKLKCWDLWYYPHYSTMFCPWKGQEDDPCGCSNDKRLCVGSWYLSGHIDGDEKMVMNHLKHCPGYTKDEA